MSGTSWWRKLVGTREAPGKTGRTEVKGTGRKAARSTPAGSAQPAGRPGRRGSVAQDAPVLGVVVGRSGWIGAHLDASGHGTPVLVLAPSLEEVVARAGTATVVAADVPMGLPDDTRREADGQARSVLGDKGAAVFTTPVREAVYAASHGEANAINRERIGSGLSTQANERRRRILEVDSYLRQDLPFTIVETHPDVAFAVLAGAPLQSRKKSAEGAEERRQVLAGAGIHVPTSAPVGVSTDEMIDACVAAWTAHRVKTGAARSFPDRPEIFSDGIPAAIHA